MMNYDVGPRSYLKLVRGQPRMPNSCSFNVVSLIFKLGMVKRVYNHYFAAKKFTRKPEEVLKIDLLDQNRR